MYKLVVIGTIAAAAFGMTHPVNHDIVNDIKNKADSWTPFEVEANPLRALNVAEIKGLLGTIVQGPVGLPGPAPSNGDVPSTFDSRDKWGKCVHPIRDQARCGSCWAFGASEALSDRICIASGGSVDVILSPEDLVACDGWNMGCNGGILPWAWSYLTKTGAVTDDCFPYSSADGSVPKCSKKCADGSDYKKYKCKSGSVVEAKGVQQIKTEILNSGPVETGFTVYEDFMSYSSGVYRHVSGDQLGGHAVKIVGWGDGYWICANSWGTGWGETGFFNIAFGECGIDNAAYGCTPAL
jgi:cathepsin B